MACRRRSADCRETSACRSLKQSGQSLWCVVREYTYAAHSWPLSHHHHTLRSEPGRTWPGQSVPFLVGCHSRAVSRILFGE